MAVGIRGASQLVFFNLSFPGLLQVQDHDDAELGSDPGQRDEADGAGNRQVVSERVEQPEPAN